MLLSFVIVPHLSHLTGLAIMLRGRARLDGLATQLIETIASTNNWIAYTTLILQAHFITVQQYSKLV